MDLPFPASISRNGDPSKKSKGLAAPMKQLLLNPLSGESIKAGYKAAFSEQVDKLKGDAGIPKLLPKDLPTEKFFHASLKAPHHIRLMRINRIDSNGLISCALEHHDRSQAPPHVALSYVWTDYGSFDRARDFRPQPSVVPVFGHDDSTTIAVNGRSLVIGANLYEALRGLHPHLQGSSDKDGGSSEWLWVDAICINQADEAEKSTQVASMSTTYSHASHVFIWLGRRMPVRTAAFDVIRRWPDFPSPPTSPVTFNGRTHASAKEFFDRTASTGDFVSWLSLFRAVTEGWWSRAWTLQEFVLARQGRAVFFYGGERVAAEDLEKAMRWTTFAAGVMPTSIMPRWTALQPSVFDLKRRGRPLELLEAAVLGATRMAADPRDKLYGMISLIDPTELGDPPLKPDYASRDLNTFYITIAQRLIHSKAGLQTLSLVNHPLPREEYSIPGPSKPIGNRLLDNFLTKKRLAPRPRSSDGAPPKEDVWDASLQPDWDGTGTGTSEARLPSWVPRLIATLATPPLFLRELRAQGILGRALHDPSWRIFHTSGPATASSSSKTFSLSADGRTLSVRIHILDAIRQSTRLPQTPGSEPSFWKTIRSWWPRDTKLADTAYALSTKSPGGHATIPEALWRTLLANIWLTNHPAAAACAGFFGSYVARAEGGHNNRAVKRDLGLPESPDPNQGDIFAAALDSAGLDRSLFITEEGYLGLGPPRARQGDRVVVIEGAHVPFVLRKLESGQYLLVGEAYVHGIMYGEIARRFLFNDVDIV